MVDVSPAGGLASVPVFLQSPCSQANHSSRDRWLRDRSLREDAETRRDVETTVGECTAHRELYCTEPISRRTIESRRWVADPVLLDTAVPVHYECA